MMPSWSEILAQIEAIAEADAPYVSIDYADAEDESCALFYRVHRNATGDRADKRRQEGEHECI